MSGLEDDVVTWWDGLNDDQRSRVKQAAEQAAEKHDVGIAGVKVLIDTRCPVGPVGTKWDSGYQPVMAHPSPT